MVRKSAFVVALMLLTSTAVFAQQGIWHRSIDINSVNVRGTPVALEHIGVLADEPGTFVVTFDGKCLPSVGDNIILAASDHEDWTTNNGNVSVRTIDGDVGNVNFSHTRVYTANIGMNHFYAIAENYISTGGTGVIAVYASLTVKFFPDAGNGPKVAHADIVRTSVDANFPLVLDSVPMTFAQNGRVSVRFDGQVYGSPGDRLVLSANLSPNLSPGAGQVSFEPYDALHNIGSFSTTQVYNVVAGTTVPFYAVIGAGEKDGDGIASVYGALVVEFYPEDLMGSGLLYTPVSNTYADLRTAVKPLRDLSYNAPTSGRVIVRFDGWGTPSVGDRLIVAASDHYGWTPNAGNTSIEAQNADVNRIAFSHTRAYDVAPGLSAFAAVAQNYVELDGDGTGSLYGMFTLLFVPGGTTAVSTLVTSHEVRADEGANTVTWTVSGPTSPSDFVVHRLDAQTNRESLCAERVELSDAAFVLRDRKAKPGASYRYRVSLEEAGETFLLFESDTVTTRPMGLAFHTPQPNPFNPSTKLSFVLPTEGEVELTLYNVAGRQVRRLVDGVSLGAGLHTEDWDGRDDAGRSLGSGVYIAQLKVSNAQLSQRLTLVK